MAILEGDDGANVDEVGTAFEKIAAIRVGCPRRPHRLRSRVHPLIPPLRQCRTARPHRFAREPGITSTNVSSRGGHGLRATCVGRRRRAVVPTLADAHIARPRSPVRAPRRAIRRPRPVRRRQRRRRARWWSSSRAVASSSWSSSWGAASSSSGAGAVGGRRRRHGQRGRGRRGVVVVVVAFGIGVVPPHLHRLGRLVLGLGDAVPDQHLVPELEDRPASSRRGTATPGCTRATPGCKGTLSAPWIAIPWLM